MLTIDQNGLRFGRSSHPNSIQLLNIKGHFPIHKHRYSINYLASLTRNRIMEMKISGSGFNIQKILGPFLRRTYLSPVIGFDPGLENIKTPIKLFGYFQTPNYFNSLLKEDPNIGLLDLAKPSEWYSTMQGNLESKKILALHIRRGDYSNLKETKGLLAEKYYLQALENLQVRGVQWEKIWIFSDASSESIKIEFAELLNNYDAEIIQAPKHVTPAEQLLVMSKASFIVIANSTFSWWGAMLGTPAKIVVCPEKWFKNEEAPSNLCPDNWIRSESIWV